MSDIANSTARLGFASRESCASVSIGWETSLGQLAEFLETARAPSP